MCKLDLEKPMVILIGIRGYLLNTLIHMGFRDKWLKWIDFVSKLLGSPFWTIAILLVFFHSDKGRWVRGSGDLHLLYADDAILFCESRVEQAT